MKQENKEPKNYITERVKTGNFFTDSKDWFYYKYAYIYKSKLNFLILLITLFFIVFVVLFFTIFSILNVKAKNGVADFENDFGEEIYMQKITKHYNNNEKNIIRFILESYINYFETYKINKYDIYKLNERIDIIKRFSSKQVGDKFEKIARNNYTSEIFSGIVRESRIVNFEFIMENQDFLTQTKRVLLAEKTPKKVKVGLISTAFKDDGRFVLKEERRNIEIIFDYKPIEKESDGNFNDLNFKVISYNYINI